MLKIKDFSKVRFVKSITNIKTQAPEISLPEIAFAGRSNVGKSSLLNALFNRKSLVKTSSTPGKTQLINYFDVNQMFYCVDLPGYGFAKVPAKIKAKWQQTIETYILESKKLIHIYVLIDSRHGPMNSDLEMIEWLAYYKKPFSIILSKTDKININQMKSIKQNLDKELPDINVIPFSVKRSVQIKDLKAYILDLINA